MTSVTDLLLIKKILLCANIGINELFTAYMLLAISINMLKNRIDKYIL